MKYGLANELRLMLGRELKLAEMKNENGEVTYVAEEFEVGYSVGIQSEAGIVPVPVGEYILSDGRTMIVEQEGIIGQIMEVQAPEAPEMENEAQAEAPTPEATPKRVVESVSKEMFFEAIEVLKADFEAKLEALKPVESVVELEAVKPLIPNDSKVYYNGIEVKFKPLIGFMIASPKIYLKLLMDLANDMNVLETGQMANGAEQMWYANVQSIACWVTNQRYITLYGG